LDYIPPSVTNSETPTHTSQSQTHTNKPRYILKTNVTIAYFNTRCTSSDLWIGFVSNYSCTYQRHTICSLFVEGVR